MRRRIREIYRKNKYKLKKGKIIFLLHRSAIEADYYALLNEFEKMKGLINE